MVGKFGRLLIHIFRIIPIAIAFGAMTMSAIMKKKLLTLCRYLGYLDIIFTVDPIPQRGRSIKQKKTSQEAYESNPENINNKLPLFNE